MIVYQTRGFTEICTIPDHTCLWSSLFVGRKWSRTLLSPELIKGISIQEMHCDFCEDSRSPTESRWRLEAWRGHKTRGGSTSSTGGALRSRESG
ncbi:hypothetical protein HZ326_2653, partial [Fusarium oxysporum f. sp. albedinis]